MFPYILIGVIIILFLVYLNGRYNKYYWEKRGVAFYNKNKVLGVTWDFATSDQSFTECLSHIYKEFPNDPAVGIGSFLTPMLYVKDITNVQHILHGDFQFFNHRGIETSDQDILAGNVLMQNGKRWRLLRHNMSPLFTAVKIKNMFYIIDKGAVDFIDHLKNNPDKLKSDDAFQIFSTFCSAAIGAAVFGITTQSTYNSPFLEMAQHVLAPTFRKNLKFVLSSVITSSVKMLNLKLFEEYEKFFIPAIKQLIRQREKENVKKHDFADLCVSLQKNGIMKDPDTGLELEPTDELLAAQAFFYFIAGVEPTATAIYNAVMELGRNPEILQRALLEVDKAFDSCNNKLTYDVVNDMKYIEKVMNESMRMYPPIGFMTRQCTRNTVLPVGNIKVDKGTKIFTPIFDYHRDPKFYENPDVFDPERFENDVKGGDFSYQPFGKGARICLGMRYAKMQAKTGLVHFLRYFTVETTIHEGGIKFSKQQVQVRTTNADVKFIPRKHKTG